MGHKEVLVTHLRKIMLEELQRRNYSDGTIRRYLHMVEDFARHFGKSPDKLGLEHLRSYQAYLLKARKLSVGSVVSVLHAWRIGLDKRPCVDLSGRVLRRGVNVRAAF
jgi:integrase/recombinase XerD